MVQIQKPNEGIVKLLGKQNYSNKIKYRMLYFCLSVPTDDGILLFNNLTKGLYLLSNEEFDKIKNMSTCNNDDFYITLLNEWFFVPENNDDYTLCEQLRQIVGKYSKSEGIKFYTILPTTACNARCFYCFEAGIPTVTMSDEVADATAEYIIRNSKGKITLNWFGGEPLCNIRAIDRICKKLRENNIDFHSRMDSNSYLFNQDNIVKATELWNLKMVHLTLDGLPETYNKVKNYFNNDNNAFYKVLNNIRLLCEAKIKILVRLNMDSHNFAELSELVDLLKKEFSQYKNFNIYATPLYEGPEYVIKSRTDIERIRITKEITDITNHIKDQGFNSHIVGINEFSYYACQADKKDYVVIVPDGHLAFCEHYVSDDYFGTVYDDVEKPFWSDYRKPFPECKACVCAPTCRFLERCPGASRYCFDYNRILRINAFKDSVKHLYFQIKKKKQQI